MQGDNQLKKKILTMSKNLSLETRLGIFLSCILIGAMSAVLVANFLSKKAKEYENEVASKKIASLEVIFDRYVAYAKKATENSCSRVFLNWLSRRPA